MTRKFNIEESLSAPELASHLSNPDGETGKQVGLLMNEGNKHICLNSYKVLAPKGDDRILEIGMGNGFFIPELLSLADNLTYVGVDYSSTMVGEALVLNAELLESKQVELLEASIEKLPFDDNSFDCIATTNTLYFWPDPGPNAQELLRVLRPEGRLLIGYREKAFMDKIEISNYGFTQYTTNDVEALLSNAGFRAVQTESIDEPELEFAGKPFEMTGFYTIGVKSI